MSDDKRDRLQHEVLSEPAGEEHVRRVLDAARPELELQRRKTRRERFRILLAIPAAAAVATFAGWFVTTNNKQSSLELEDLELAEQFAEADDSLELLALEDEDWELFEDWEELEEDKDVEDV